jgi:hypothetical protein
MLVIPAVPQRVWDAGVVGGFAAHPRRRLIVVPDERRRLGQRDQGSGRGEHDYGEASLGMCAGQRRPAFDVTGVPVRRVQHEHLYFGQCGLQVRICALRS